MTEDIKSCLPEELRQALIELGEPAYRAGQVFTWLHRGVTSFSAMTDLPKALRKSWRAGFISRRLISSKSRSPRGTARSNTSGVSGTATRWRAS